MPASSAANTEPSHVFELWLSQWKLSILDCESAMSILASVLESMLAKSAQDAFWQYLAQFFSSADDSPVDSSIDSSLEGPNAASGLAENPDMLRQLVERATRLPPGKAKRLLEHLSRSYSLDGADVAFWRIVEKALKYEETQHAQPSVWLV